MKKTLQTRHLYIAGALVLGLFIVAAAVEWKRSLGTRHVSVDITNAPEGSHLITAEDIRTSIQRSFGHALDGVPVADLDVERVERVLESDPFILNAEVYVDAGNDVHIAIEQRQPIVRVIGADGVSYYLDEAGKRMPLSKHFAARVLVATGKIPPFTPEFLDKRRHGLKDVFEIVQALRAHPFLDAMIEQIDVDDKGKYILIPKVGDQQIILGDASELADKLERLLIFYKEAIAHEGWQKYKRIDLSFRGQVVCEKNA